jgi:predicted dehydrogenase
VRVALIGCGVMGRKRALALCDFPDDELVVVADVDRHRASQLATEMTCFATTDWEEAVARADIEIVIVATTHDWLTAVTLAALRLGKHVLVEKPMGRTPAEAEQICSAVETAGLIVKVGFNHRHHPAIRMAHELCQAGVIGDILFARCRYGHGGRPGYGKEWRANLAIAGGGELLDQGIHAIDLFRWFIGEFSEAAGFTASYFWTNPSSLVSEGAAGPHHNPGAAAVEDNAFALFRTSHGQVASLHASWTQWKNQFSFEVFGTTGYLLVEGLGGSYGLERLTVGRQPAEGGPPSEDRHEFPGPDQSWNQEWRDFIAAIREGHQPLTTGQDGLRALRMVHAVYDSARSGRVSAL